MHTTFDLSESENPVLLWCLVGKRRLENAYIRAWKGRLGPLLRRLPQPKLYTDAVRFLGIDWIVKYRGILIVEIKDAPVNRRPWLLWLTRVYSISVSDVIYFDSVEQSPFKSGVYDLRTAHGQVSYKRDTTGEKPRVRFDLYIGSGTLRDRAELYVGIITGRAPSRRLSDYSIEWLESGYERDSLEQLARRAAHEGISMPEGILTRQDYIDALVDNTWDKWLVEEARQKAGRIPAEH